MSGILMISTRPTGHDQQPGWHLNDSQGLIPVQAGKHLDGLRIGAGKPAWNDYRKGKDAPR